jgi:hypothetical protein
MDATGRSRVTFASQSPRSDSDPGAAITNVGLVFAVRIGVGAPRRRFQPTRIQCSAALTGSCGEPCPPMMADRICELGCR